MTANRETEDAQAGRAAFLQAVALSIRNHHSPAERTDFLRDFEYRVRLMEANPLGFGLSTADLLELRNLSAGLHHYLTYPGFAIADPPQGATH